MAKSMNRKALPEDYRRVAGSESSPEQEMRLVGTAGVC
jgi:hypothetical protein